MQPDKTEAKRIDAIRADAPCCAGSGGSMTAYAESITKAAQTAANLLRQDLRAAYRDAGQVEAIILERLLSEAAELERTLIRMAEATK